MSWNGSGTFTRSNGTYSGATVWAQDDNNGYDIEADRHDTHDQDIATGINTCLTKDGQNSPSAHIQWLNKATWAGTSGGAAGAYTLTLSPVPVAYYTGMRLTWVPNHSQGTNTATLNVNGLGAVQIRDGLNLAIPSYSLISGSAQVVDVVYTGTYFTLIATNPIRNTSWAPTLSGGGTGGPMGIGTSSFTAGEILVDPVLRRAFFSIDVTFTTTGTASNAVLIDTTGYSARFANYAAMYVDGGLGAFEPAIAYHATSTQLWVQRATLANFGIGASRRIFVSGSWSLT